MGQTLEQIIRNHVALPHKTNARGWYQVLCKICNDHGRKGKRAGFHFESNGAVGYNCFNCGHTAVFDPSASKSMSQNMTAVLEAFGVSKDEWQPLLFDLMSKDQSFVSKPKKKENYEPPQIELPPYFTPIDENGDDFDLYAIMYLKDVRGVDWKSHPFYLGRKTDNPGSKKWYGRLIIPFFKDGKLVFYQGRDLTDTRQRKYLSPDISRENVLYGYEHIFRDTDEPLYIMEGWFDAWHLEGVAVLGSKMTPHQVFWINQTRRPKVVIPDRFGDGYLLAEQALEHGWLISTPDIGDCKDPNEAIMKYGKMYTLMSIRNHTYEGFEATVRLKFFCEKKNDPRRSPSVRKGAHKV